MALNRFVKSMSPSGCEDTPVCLIESTVAGWPDLWRNAFMVWVRGYQNPDRGFGFRVKTLSYEDAMRKAFREHLPYLNKINGYVAPKDDSSSSALSQQFLAYRQRMLYE